MAVVNNHPMTKHLKKENKGVVRYIRQTPDTKRATKGVDGRVKSAFAGQKNKSRT